MSIKRHVKRIDSRLAGISFDKDSVSTGLEMGLEMIVFSFLIDERVETWTGFDHLNRLNLHDVSYKWY